MIVWSVFDRCSRCVWHLIWKKQLYSSAPVQCDQIGRYWKFLATKFLTTFWAILKNSLLCKNCISYFLGNFWKNWATFFSNIWSHCLRTTGAQARAKMLEFGDKFIAQLMDIYFWTSLLPLQNFIMQFTDPGLSRNSFLQI